MRRFDISTLKKRTALLRFKNADAESNAAELRQAGSNFVFIPQPPIADITTATAWLYTAIAKSIILPKYSVYDLISEMPSEGSEEKKQTNALRKKLESIKAHIKSEQEFIDAANDLCLYLGYETCSDHLNKLFLTVSQEKFYPAFDTAIYPNVAITLHSSKGLEFDQVILFANDYNLADEAGKYNHYVAITRAREKVVIVKFPHHRSDKFEDDLSGIFALSNLKVCDLVAYK